MHLGVAYSVTGEDAEAIRSWERALEMGGPFDVEIRNLARSLRSAALRAEARILALRGQRLGVRLRARLGVRLAGE